jgi:hypothetical protein
MAPAVAPAADAPRTASCQFLANAPDQHKVVRGDTLWDISARFLEHPWCWPQVWGLNRDQIRNPHWIYPGQIVIFDRASGRLRLAGDADGIGGVPTVKLSPHVRAENLEAQAIPAIPANVIEPFLTQPLLLEESALQGAPHVVQGEDGRVVLGKGDKAYVRGDLGDATVFQIYRPASALRDPDTREVLGHEAVYLGIARLDRPASAPNEAHRFIITGSEREIGPGALLTPLPPMPLVNYAPHRPQAPVEARIISVYGGMDNAGQNAVVTINRGKSNGLDVGSVLELYRYGKVVKDRGAGNQPVRLPDEKSGTLFIFRTFDRVSYGLVMQVANRIQVGDAARSPE